MHQTEKTELSENRILVDSTELKEICGTGMQSAIRIGTAAGAKVKIGRRTMWSIDKVKKYLTQLCE